MKFTKDSTTQNYLESTLQQTYSKFAKSISQKRTYKVSSLSNSARASIFLKNYFVVKTTDSLECEALFVQLQQQNNFSVQRNYLYRIHSIPNDSAFSSQWNLTQTKIKNLFANGIINSNLPSIKVGVIDTGIDEEHPDLSNAIAINAGETGIDSFGNDKRTNGIDDDDNGYIDDWRGYDFVDMNAKDGIDWKERDNLPYDENGHGTGVSGIIGANSNNGIGISGFGPIKILPVRAFSAGGIGSDIDISLSIIYAADNGAEVINMSFGDIVQSTLLHDAIRYAYSKNVVLVASSGNDGSNKSHYPSDFNEVISTGSVGQSNARSYFSSYSPSLDIMAPGEMIPTTAIGNNYTNNFTGTSAAAPHVSGIAALLKSVEKKNNLFKPNYIPFTVDEIRGMLLNSADDIGESGWDAQTASGIVNAEKLLSAARGAEVKILSPSIDEVVTKNITIVATAISPYANGVEVSFGEGESPKNWKTIFKSSKIFVNDSLCLLDITSLTNGIYTLRLRVNNSKGNDVENRIRIYVNNSAPKIIFFSLIDSVVTGSEYCSLTEIETDRITYGKLLYRKKGTSDSFSMLRTTTFGRNHSFILTSKDFIPNQEYEFYCEFTENSAEQRKIIFPTIQQTGFQYFKLQLPAQNISHTGFSKMSASLPPGFILHSNVYVGSEQLFIVNEYKNNGDYGILKSYKYSNGNFLLVDSLNRSWIPRSFYKDALGNNLLLVQEYGISRIYKIDPITKKFIATPVWGDSNVVWGSQLVDLNGDNMPEIIARDSQFILVYKNLGNNSFARETTLSNPSQPLYGESKNQFGPPKTLVGDFTGAGKLEIVFADYDGDVIMYRQEEKNSFKFKHVWTDSSYLFEMSDYLTAGDFNGDGILDFAVAAHSYLGQNDNREYYAPTWNVRVFSKSKNGNLIPDKIWELEFFGVRAGTTFDNGIMSGKISSLTQNDLLLSFNPNLYLFKYDQSAKSFVPYWTSYSSSNGAFIADITNDGKNEIGFNTEYNISFYSLSIGAQPQIPWNVIAKPISESTVQLTWNSNSIQHNIYKGTSVNSLNKVASVFAKQWIDSSAVENSQYFYAVTSASFNESEISTVVSAIPHKPAKIIRVMQNLPTQLLVSFSYNIGNVETANFIVDSLYQPNSVTQHSKNKILLSFVKPIAEGSHVIKIRSLIDESGMLADTTTVFAFTTTLKSDERFLILQAALLSENVIALTFNEEIKRTSSVNISLYKVSTAAREFPIEQILFDSTKPAQIKIKIVSGVLLNSLALRLEIQTAKEVESISGRNLNGGKGQIVSIAQETQSLEHIVVFPNPFNVSKQNSSEISFVNLPKNCRISIYSLNGEPIQTFSELTTEEGIKWNLADKNGKIISSGIYLYRVEKIDYSGNTTETKLGKFAIIR